MLSACDPLIQFTVSSNTRVLPSRELFALVGLGLLMLLNVLQPALLPEMENPFMSPTDCPGYIVVLFVGCVQLNDCVSGSVVACTPPCDVEARTSVSSLATSGSMREVCPLRAPSAIRSIVPPEYWKRPFSDEGLMIVRVSIRV